MKMIASKTLYKIFLCLIAFVSLAFASCSLMDADMNTDADLNVDTNIIEGTSEFAVLKICCDGSLGAARTIMPDTPQSLNDMSNFVLTGEKDSSGTVEELKTWSSYSQIASTSLELLPGIWDFTLSADYNGVPYTGTANGKTLVKDTSTTLNFTLEPTATGNGSISVTIKWPDSSSDQVQKVTAGLYDSAGSAVGFDTNLTISGTSAIYENNAVATGNYLVKFNFYRDTAGTDKINTYVCALQVVAGFDSTGTETITLLNNKYTLTLDANGGTFAAGVPTTRTFTEYEYVDLPTDSDVSYTSYALAGWYEDAACTGTEVKSWDVGGMKRDLTLYAKWEVVSEIYLDGTSGSDSNTGEDVSHAVATLAKALEKLNPAAPNPKIIIVNPYTLLDTETSLLDFSTRSNTVTIERYYSSNPAEHCSGNLLTISSGTVDIKNVTFDGNWKKNGNVQISDASGSLLYVGSGATVTLGADCTIKNNSNIKSSGGGVFIYNGGTLILSGGTISGNKARNGCAVIINSSGIFTMSSGRISGNTADASGGGIYNFGGTFTMSGGTISENSAGDSGGIYNSAAGTFTMSGGTISGNIASNNGGGIGNAGTFTMSGGEISGNTATTGKGVYGYDIGTLNLKFSGSAIVNANNDVYLPSGKFITITGDLSGTNVATITPNSYSSGRVVLQAANADLITNNYSKFALPSTVTNYAIAQDDTTKTNAVIVDNTPRETVYLDATGGSDVKDGLTKANAVKTLKRATSILKDAVGAKIIIVSAYTLLDTETGLLDFSTRSNTVTLERYYLNSSDYFTGSMLTISSGTVVIKNVTFDGNWKANGGTGSEQIPNAGGALLYVSSSGATVTLGEGCTIKNNSKTGNGTSGGGIYNYGGTITMSGGTISGNSAAFGGGIANNGGTFTMSGGTISGNSAGLDGGGIYIYSGTVTMSGGTISENTATSVGSNGGGICNAGGTITMSGGTISGNKATSCGGGIFIGNGSTTTVSGGTIKNNAATYNPTNGSGGQGICVWKGTLELEGGAKIESDTVRLMGGLSSTDPHLKITGKLTAAGTVATIWPTEYAEGAVILEADNADLITANYRKFTLSDTSTYAIYPDSTNTKQAVLTKPSTGVGVGLLGSDFVFTLKKNNAAVSAGTKLAAGDTLTFSVAPDSISGVTFTKYKISVLNGSTELPALTASGSSLSAASVTITASQAQKFAQVGTVVNIFMEVTVKIDDNGPEYKFDRIVEGFTFN